MRTAALVAAALGSAALVTGCSGSARPQAQQACRLVGKSLQTLAQSQHESGPAADRDRAAALEELRAALPIAALAATQDGQWQALDATLSESSRVTEANLVPALTRECAATVP
ncbi:MAG: hypothetical protein ACREQ5_38840 [Candidatus Dormibacteria bacterium]